MKEVFFEHRTHIFMMVFLSGLFTHAISVVGLNIFTIILIVLTVIMWILVLTSISLSLSVKNKEDDQ